MKGADSHCTRPPELRPDRISAPTAVVAHEVRENRGGQVLPCGLLRNSVTVMWTMDHMSHTSNTLSHIQTVRQLVSMWSGFERQERGRAVGVKGKGVGCAAVGLQ